MVHPFFRLGETNESAIDAILFHRLLQAKPKLGKVEVKFSDRVELSKQQLNFRDVNVLMTSSIVSSLILMNRRGVSKELLLSNFKKLYNDLRDKKAVISLTTKPTPEIVSHYLEIIKNQVAIKRGVIMPKTDEEDDSMYAKELSYQAFPIFNDYEAEIYLLTPLIQSKELGISELMKRSKMLQRLVPCKDSTTANLE